MADQLQRLAYCLYKGRLSEVALSHNALFVLPVARHSAQAFTLGVSEISYTKAVTIPLRLFYCIPDGTVAEPPSPPFMTTVAAHDVSYSYFPIQTEWLHFSYEPVKGTHSELSAFKVKPKGPHGEPLKLRFTSSEIAAKTAAVVRQHAHLFSSPSTTDLAPSSSSSTEITAVASSSSALRKTLVIINPKSGRKRSQKLFSKHVQHILDTAKLPYEVKTTEYAGHAADICLELNVDEYECVATCSGDGLVHECMNGFLSRPDYQQIKDRVSFCPVPCGTSNALAASFYMVRPEDAAIALCRRESLPCDVFTFELIGDAVSSTKEGTTTTTTEEEKPTAKKEGEVVAAAKSGSVALRMDKRLAFLMVAWGFIADCDLGTENMRWMGSLRNQVGALKFIQKKKRQHARIRYQKADAADGEWTETEDDFFIVILCNLPYISFDVAFSPSSRARDGQLHLIMVRDAKRMDMLKLFTVVEKGNHLPNPSVECVPVKTAEVLFDPSKCDTYISLDGEPMPLQSFRVQVCPDSVMNIRGLNLYLPSAKL